MAESWHALPVQDAFQRLDSGPLGLDARDVRERLVRYGPNEIVQLRKISRLKIFLSQFLDLLVVVLLVAAFLSAAIGLVQGTVEELYDAVVILVIVGFNAIFGFFQEYRAEKAIQALRALAAPQAQVIREGEILMVPSAGGVPGDVVLLNAGDKVPADARLFEVASLRVNEAPLTGESVAASKVTDALPASTVLPDRRNMAYAGCVIEAGRAKGVVVGTGMKTELGRIAGLVQSQPSEETPLQRQLDRLGRTLGIVVLGICAMVFLVGYLRNPAEIVKIFLTAVSLAVAAIPESLPAVVTITLALGLQRMLACGALCNDAQLRKEGEAWKSQGDSTEAALLTLAMRGGLRREDLERALPRVAEIPFTSERKMMTTIHAPLHPEQVRRFRGLPEEDRAALIARLPGLVSFTKGAPERVLARCSRIRIGETVRPLSPAERDDLITENQDMALRGLRVLALAHQELEPGLPILAEETVESGLVFLGLVGMMDAPRKDAVQAIDACKSAGIEVVMITGDQKLTAIAVAKEMGIMNEGDQALTGAELDALDPRDFESEVERVRVYARVDPEHKLRIVDAFKKKGQIVAMTGDGVNDAPALKRADLGIAMGITGTDVAKGSADMILTDDNFASIVHAVEEGRVVYDNIRKFVRYMLSTNSGEVLLILVAALLGMPLPLIPIQILWVNLITDGFPALALGVEPEERGVMSRKPRRATESILSGGMGSHIVWVGVLMVVGTLVLYTGFLQPGMTDEELRHPRTIAFLTISLFQVFHVLAIRVWNESVFTAGFFRNRFLIVAVLLTVALQFAVIFFAPLAAVFETTPLPIEEVLLCAAVASSVFFSVELEKLVRRRRSRGPAPVPEAVA